MKQILILLYVLLLTTACNGGGSETSSSKIENAADSHVTFEFMEGQLKGTHVFNNNLKIEMYKGTSENSGALILRGAESANTGYFISSYKKKFNGEIKVGSHSSPAISFSSDGLAAALVIESRVKKLDWKNVHGKVSNQSNLTFTEVGEWSITDNNKIRRVKGSFSDIIELEYGNYAKILAKETVELSVSFDLLEVRAR